MGAVLTDEQERRVRAFLEDGEARLSLYWILDKTGAMRRFALNPAQRDLRRAMAGHPRHYVLKARQLGISTLACLLELDACLFRRNFTAVIVDKRLEDGEKKLEKIRFAYEHLDYVPPDATERDLELAEVGRMIKGEHGPLVDKRPRGCAHAVLTKSGCVAFTRTGSRIESSKTCRSATVQLLHVSELGYIAMHDPKRARDIVAGSYNSVSKQCCILAESTHEGGKSGLNYEQCVAAMDNVGKELAPVQFGFHFYPWYRDPGYVLDEEVPVPESLREYFGELRAKHGIVLRREQMWWYAAMKQTLRSLMQQEYPSTPEEALSPVMDGSIYASQIMGLREDGRLNREFPPDAHRPIYTAWDLGISDYMSIWWIQPTGTGEWLVLGNYTANRLPIDHYIGVLRERDAEWGRCALCFLPHDGGHHDHHYETWADALRKAGYSVRTVPPTRDLWMGVERVREVLEHAVFHARCGEPTVANMRSYPSGLDALQNYRLADAGVQGAIPVQPLHDEFSHAADALRTFADALELGWVARNAGWDRPRTPARGRGSFYDWFKS